MMHQCFSRALVGGLGATLIAAGAVVVVPTVAHAASVTVSSDPYLSVTNTNAYRWWDSEMAHYRWTVTGVVTNRSASTRDFVKLSVRSLTSGGSVVSTDTNRYTTLSRLGPGESSPFTSSAYGDSIAKFAISDVSSSQRFGSEVPRNNRISMSAEAPRLVNGKWSIRTTVVNSNPIGVSETFVVAPFDANYNQLGATSRYLSLGPNSSQTFEATLWEPTAITGSRLYWSRNTIPVAPPGPVQYLSCWTDKKKIGFSAENPRIDAALPITGVQAWAKIGNKAWKPIAAPHNGVKYYSKINVPIKVTKKMKRKKIIKRVQVAVRMNVANADGWGPTASCSAYAVSGWKKK